MQAFPSDIGYVYDRTGAYQRLAHDHNVPAYKGRARRLKVQMISGSVLRGGSMIA